MLVNNFIYSLLCFVFVCLYEHACIFNSSADFVIYHYDLLIRNLNTIYTMQKSGQLPAQAS
jgi:hypothetical protein